MDESGELEAVIVLLLLLLLLLLLIAIRSSVVVVGSLVVNLVTKLVGVSASNEADEAVLYARSVNGELYRLLAVRVATGRGADVTDLSLRAVSHRCLPRNTAALGW
jgi:hypothetical protein